MARGLRAIFLLIIAVLAAVWWVARPAAPDPFYEAAIPAGAGAGLLLRAEPFTRRVPDGAKAWRILYVTVGNADQPALASAIVVAPSVGQSLPRPVIGYAHGTAGLQPGCAPSLLADPFFNVPAFGAFAAEGWVYVATDYVGLGTGGGHAYLVGPVAGRAVLDAVQAAGSIDGLVLAPKTMIWGHSQGGGAALWAGALATDHAPGINLRGVAALAPASDLPALARGSQATQSGKIVSALVIRAFGENYPDVRAEDYLHAASALLVNDITGRCVVGWPTLLSVAAAWLLPADGIFSRDPTMGPLGARLLQNIPTLPIAVPVLIAQGSADDLVLEAIQNRYVEARCAAGQQIDYRRYAGLGHISLIRDDAPSMVDLVAWTRARLAGLPLEAGCAPK